MKNRIVEAVARMEAQIKDRIAKSLVTKEKVEETRKALDMDMDEFVSFQELKSLAVASGKLNAEEGMTIYNYLGTVPTVFNKQPCHVKAVLTSLLKELLQARMAGRLAS